MHAPINSLAGLLLQRQGEKADRLSLIHLLVLPSSAGQVCAAQCCGECTSGVSLLGRFGIERYSCIKQIRAWHAHEDAAMLLCCRTGFEVAANAAQRAL